MSGVTEVIARTLCTVEEADFYRLRSLRGQNRTPKRRREKSKKSERKERRASQGQNLRARPSSSASSPRRRSCRGHSSRSRARRGRRASGRFSHLRTRLHNTHKTSRQNERQRENATDDRRQSAIDLPMHRKSASRMNGARSSSQMRSSRREKATSVSTGTNIRRGGDE